ncbi:MAG: haloacid dehalogenase type II [Mucilaginibacter sp.]|uniref:haloacid dehalogenase type II n=1 Tax=Mucilaginibacter sp. TaxID=1882438 RepID=UPI003266FD5C
MERLDFLRITGALSGSLMVGGITNVFAGDTRTIKAIAFDGFAIFDPRPVFNLAEEFFPGRGVELSNLWKTKQFEYTWLHNITGTYINFYKVINNALTFAAKVLKIDLDDLKRQQLMLCYLNLKPWPDVAGALQTLKASGVRLVILSNFTDEMLKKGIDHGQLQGVFEHCLSTDKVKKFKPDPMAYQMAVDAFGLNKSEILFVAFAGWDAAGAKQFGYKTFWSNRLGLPAEELGAYPDATGKDLKDLLTYIG